tara:strand:+ start:434 stop:1552 length:1119 start_codon:yes stop_codon:yes gene_type:complete
MPKVGILSLPLNWNYGGILQQYALSEYLKKNNLEPILISRRLKRNFLILLLVKIKWKLIYYFGKYEKFNFLPLLATEKFKQKHLNTRTKDLYSSEELRNYTKKNKIKIFLVGSDQIWNVEATPSLKDSYIGFLQNNSKCLIAAYGASFAHDDWKYSKSETILCQKLIKNFFLVSVREKQGTLLTKKFLKKKSIRVLDPTFLLKKKDYFKIIKKQNKKNKSLFCYILDNDIYKQKFIKSYAKKKGLKFIDYCDFSIKSNVFKFKKNFTVENWISDLYYSNFVITDSFHGMVFSIIFKKNFLIFLNKKRGASRIVSLLEDLGLKDRIIYSTNFDISKTKQINWKSVHNKLIILTNSSKNFLKKIFIRIKKNLYD